MINNHDKFSLINNVLKEYNKNSDLSEKVQEKYRK